MRLEIGEAVEVRTQICHAATAPVLLSQLEISYSRNISVLIQLASRCTQKFSPKRRSNVQVQGDAREGFPGSWVAAKIIAKDLGFVTVIYDDVSFFPCPFSRISRALPLYEHNTCDQVLEGDACSS